MRRQWQALVLVVAWLACGAAAAQESCPEITQRDPRRTLHTIEVHTYMTREGERTQAEARALTRTLTTRVLHEDALVMVALATDAQVERLQARNVYVEYADHFDQLPRRPGPVPPGWEQIGKPAEPTAWLVVTVGRAHTESPILWHAQAIGAQVLGVVEANGTWMWMTAAQARRVARVKGVEGVTRVEAMEKLGASIYDAAGQSLGQNLGQSLEKTPGVLPCKQAASLAARARRFDRQAGDARIVVTILLWDHLSPDVLTPADVAAVEQRVRDLGGEVVEGLQVVRIPVRAARELARMRAVFQVEQHFDVSPAPAVLPAE